MKKTNSNPAPYLDRIRSWARHQAYGGSQPSDAEANDSNPNQPDSNPTRPVGNSRQPSSASSVPREKDASRAALGNAPLVGNGAAVKQNNNAPPDTSNVGNPAAPASEAEGQGSILNPDEPQQKKEPNIVVQFFLVAKKVLFHSWMNVFLVFVPVGIAIANVPGMSAGAIFGINAVAIIPLAGLLSHATESVARKMGDTLGALLNVSFGNAVELIIFIIALVKGEIRIVQASLLGSILANLLLILGMAFFLGGMRYREQIYNSTVTQMSACLLSLSVISLVLPTAFHASFSSKADADANSLTISRGTSVILLLVYIVYLLFQLRSHAYMYESTPQHIIDEESTPGPAAVWLDSSSSSESSSSSDSDSDSSGHSKNTMSKRVKRAIRRRRRKSNATSDSSEGPRTRTSSLGINSAISPLEEGPKNGESSSGHGSLPRMRSFASEDVAIEEEPKHKGKHSRKSKKKERRHRKESNQTKTDAARSGENIVGQLPGAVVDPSAENGEPRRVDFADASPMETGFEGPEGDNNQDVPRRPFNNIRGLSFRPVAKSLTPAVFAQPTPDATASGTGGPVPRVRYGIRRTNSLPDRLGQQAPVRPPGGMPPAHIPHRAVTEASAAVDKDDEAADDLTKKSAVIMLLISTALVATCAEFMVDAINAVTESSPLKETFIGLIILPIVGNAAEHVTAVVVAMRNKMDLAIGVAVGSSIQIALFLTPLVVILGWILNEPMTLYFTLFETVCLFVSAFIVNFLVLDGRSNYLEGALLMAVYVIIALAAFYYPEGSAASEWGG